MESDVMMFKQLKTNGGLAYTCIESTCYLDVHCDDFGLKQAQGISM
jgi:hypothetical protein